MIDEYSINYSPAKAVATATARLSEATQNNATESAQSACVCLELMCTIQNIREIQLGTSPGMISASDPKNTSPLLICIYIYIYIYIMCMCMYRKTQENTALSRVLSMLRSERDGKLCWQMCQPQQPTRPQYGDSATEAEQMD